MTPICFPAGTDWACAYSEDQLAAMRADPPTAAKMERSEALAWMQLAALTADQLGTCPITVRPCAAGCRPPGSYLIAPVGLAGHSAALPGRTTFAPYINGHGAWVNGCGCVSTDCSCSALCEAILPGPVGDILEVTLDGAVLDPGAYRVDNGNRLVRTDGGCWPACQDMAKPGHATYAPIVVQNVSSRITYTREGQMVHVLAETTGAPGNWGTTPWTPKGGSTTAVYAPGGGQVGSFNTSGGSKTIVGSVGLSFVPFRMSYETTDPASPVDATGTFSVTYYRGAAPDPLSSYIAGLLAVEYYKACTADKTCRLPVRLQSVARQGVTYNVAFEDDGSVGIREVDDYVRRLNPYRLKMAPVIVTPQSRRVRQTTWSR